MQTISDQELYSNFTQQKIHHKVLTEVRFLYPQQMALWQNGFMHLPLKQGDVGSNPTGVTKYGVVA